MYVHSRWIATEATQDQVAATITNLRPEAVPWGSAANAPAWTWNAQVIRDFPTTGWTSSTVGEQNDELRVMFVSLPTNPELTSAAVLGIVSPLASQNEVFVQQFTQWLRAYGARTELLQPFLDPRRLEDNAAISLLGARFSGIDIEISEFYSKRGRYFELPRDPSVRLEAVSISYESITVNIFRDGEVTIYGAAPDQIQQAMTEVGTEIWPQFSLVRTNLEFHSRMA